MNNPYASTLHFLDSLSVSQPQVTGVDIFIKMGRNKEPHPRT